MKQGALILVLLVIAIVVILLVYGNRYPTEEEMREHRTGLVVAIILAIAIAAALWYGLGSVDLKVNMSERGQEEHGLHIGWDQGHHHGHHHGHHGRHGGHHKSHHHDGWW